MKKYKIETWMNGHWMTPEYAETWREVKQYARNLKRNKDLCRNFRVHVQVSYTDEYKEFVRQQKENRGKRKWIFAKLRKSKKTEQSKK